MFYIILIYETKKDFFRRSGQLLSEYGVDLGSLYTALLEKNLLEKLILLESGSVLLSTS